MRACKLERKQKHPIYLLLRFFVSFFLSLCGIELIRFWNPGGDIHRCGCSLTVTVMNVEFSSFGNGMDRIYSIASVWSENIVCWRFQQPFDGKCQWTKRSNGLIAIVIRILAKRRLSACFRIASADRLSITSGSFQLLSAFVDFAGSASTGPLSDVYQRSLLKASRRVRKTAFRDCFFDQEIPRFKN